MSSSQRDVALFHGTTGRAATLIRNGGWVAKDPRHMVEQVAAQHGVPADALWNELASASQTFVASPGRGAHVSFALRFELASSEWAQQAPEARREALWSVWRLRNPERARLWTEQVDGHAWVLAQMADDDPVVLEVRHSYEEWLGLGAQVLELEHPDFTSSDVHSANFDVSKYDLSKTSEVLRGLPPLAELRADGAETLPEVVIPAPMPFPISSRLHVVERQVPWDVYAHWLGMEKAEFISLAEKGLLGPPGIDRLPPGMGRQKWWALTTVERTLLRRGCDLQWIPARSARKKGRR